VRLQLGDACSAVSRQWLRDEGHRAQLAQDLEQLNTAELQPKTQAFLSAHERQLREYGILAPE